MAQSCRSCKEPVSIWADKCPKCGAQSPALSHKDIGILAVITLIGIIWLFSGDEPSSQSKPESSPPAKTQEQVAAEQAACRLDLQCWADSHIALSTQCIRPIEKHAKYSFEWTDGLLEGKFSHYKWSDIDKGTVIYLGDKVKFQNGFGAWQHYRYACEIDPIKKEIVSITVEPGML